MHPLTRTKIPLYVQVKDHSRVEVATFDPEKKSWLYISKNLVFTDDEDIKNDVYLAHLFMKKKLFRFFEYSKFYVSTLAGNVVSTECEQNCQSPIP